MSTCSGLVVEACDTDAALNRKTEIELERSKVGLEVIVSATGCRLALGRSGASLCEGVRDVHVFRDKPAGGCGGGEPMEERRRIRTWKRRRRGEERKAPGADCLPRRSRRILTFARHLGISLWQSRCRNETVSRTGGEYQFAASHACSEIESSVYKSKIKKSKEPFDVSRER